MQNPPPPPPPGYPPPPPPSSGGYTPPQPPQMPGGAYVPQVYATQPAYAGFWIRVVARFVDGVIVGIPITVLFFLLVVVAGGVTSGTSSSSADTQNAAAAGVTGVVFLFYLIALLGTIAYQVYFWGVSGSTLGMRVFKLRVVDATTGGPIGIGRAFVRWLMTIVNSLACYVGWIWVAFDARKQGWHDKVANSIVIQG